MRKTVGKELFCVTTSIISSTVVLVVTILFDGIAHIAGGLDATLTTCCFVAIASPVCCVNNTPEGYSIKSYLVCSCLGRRSKLIKIREVLENATLQMSTLLPIPENSSALSTNEDLERIVLAVSLSGLSFLDHTSSFADNENFVREESAAQSIFLLKNLRTIKEDSKFSNSSTAKSARILRLSTIEHGGSVDWKSGFNIDGYTIREDEESGEM